MPPTETMKMGLHKEARAEYLAEFRKHSSKDGMSRGSLVDYESQKDQKNSRGRIVVIHEMFWFMQVFLWIVDGLVR